MTVTHEATKEMISELRRMSNRTGNKQAEKIMRDGAAWLEDVEGNRVELQNENEKLRQKLADKDEQLAGWKALLDASIASKNVPTNADANVVHKRTRPNYDYVGVLTMFMVSGKKTEAIRAERKWNGKRYPSTCNFRERAKALNLPVTASPAGNYILLSRTDLTDSEEVESQ